MVFIRTLLAAFMNSVSIISDFTHLLPASTSAEQLACIKVTGPDSVKFLQGQTSCDFTQLTLEQGLQGAVCNIKGRVIVNFYAFLRGDDILLIMASDLIETSLNHLKKFAVFFKTQLDSAQEDFKVDYVFSQDNLLTKQEMPFACEAIAPSHILAQLCQAEVNHYLYIRPSDEQNAPQIPDQNDDLFGLSLLSGQALIQAENTEKFIPQMLNMQHTHGVSFKKGCYTGQEIVARMQYRGNLKKHLYLLSTQEKLTLSAAMKLANQDGKEVAEVVSSVTLGGNTLIFAIIGDESAQAPLFYQGTPLTLEPLPYNQ
jgi:folate-binding protein YgfZ